MKIKSIAHICIKSANLKQTEKFYCDILGLEKIFNFTKNGVVKGYYFKINDDTFIEVFEDDELINDRTNISHICFETENIEKLRNEMLKCEIKSSEIKLGEDNTYQFWIKDPNGIDIEFHQYTNESSQKTRRDVEITW